VERLFWGCQVRKLLVLFLLVSIVSSFAVSARAFAGSPQPPETYAQPDPTPASASSKSENPLLLSNENDPLESSHATSQSMNRVQATHSGAQAASSIASSVPAVDEQNQVRAEPPQSDEARNLDRIIPPALSPLDTFIAKVKNGKSDAVVGIYVPQVFALKVVQQPANQPGYISKDPDEVTQFGLAASFGTIGIVAHNFLAGAQFFNLSAGQEVDILNGDGSAHRYNVTSIRHFQALSPEDPYSSFVDLDRGGPRLSSTDVFIQFYTAGNQVVLLTCIEANGNPSWGRLFVIATPIH